MNPNLDHGLIKWNWRLVNVSETNQKEGWLDPRMKLNEKKSTIATHEVVVYYPLIDWKTKKKTGLNYKRDVCDAFVASRP